MPGEGTIQFGDYELQGRRGPLSRNGREIKIEPKSLAVLWILLERRGGVVTKDELLDALWPGQQVGDESLTYQIRSLRKALGDNARKPEYIATVHRVGFRFIAPLRGDQAVAETTLNPLFVGRVRELDTLRQVWRAAAEGRQQTLFVTGEAGIGKTALLEQFIVELRAQAQPMLIARGHCSAQQAGEEPYGALVEFLGNALEDPLGAARRSAVQRAAPHWLQQLPGALSDREVRPLEEYSFGAMRNRAMREWLAAIELLSAQQPLVMVFEDLHWSDGHLLDFLAAMLQKIGRLPVLLVCTYRPIDAILTRHPVKQFKQALTAAGAAQEITLEYLDMGQVQAYAEKRMGVRLPGPGFAESLYARTDGHPLFVVQTVEYLLEKRPADLIASDALLEEVPEALRDLIDLQIDRLVPEQRHMLEVASLMGMEFPVALLAACTGQAANTVDKLCFDLAGGGPGRGQFIENAGISVWPDGTTTGKYRFRHAIYRQVLQERLPPAERAGLYAKSAQRLEHAFAGKTVQVAADLAEYYASAGMGEKSFEYRILAAKRGLSTGAPEEARWQIAKARKYSEGLAPGEPRLQAELTVTLITAHIHISTLGLLDDQTRQALTSLHRLMGQVQDVALKHEALRLLWLSSHSDSRNSDAVSHAWQTERLGRLTGQPRLEGVGMAWRSLGMYIQGQYREAWQLSQQAMTLVEAHDAGTWTNDHAEPICGAMTTHAFAAWALGYPDKALRYAQEAALRAERFGHDFMRSAALGMAVPTIHFYRREPEKLLQASLRAIPLCEAHQHREALAWCNKAKGLALCMLGQPTEGLDLLRAIIAKQAHAGMLRTLTPIYTHMAECLLQLDQAEEAGAAIEQAFQTLEQTGERFWKPELWRVRGEYLQAAGADAEDVRNCFERSLELARAGAALAFELRTANGYCHWLQARGEAAAGRGLLAPVLARFDEGFDCPDLQAAQRLIG